MFLSNYSNWLWKFRLLVLICFQVDKEKEKLKSICWTCWKELWILLTDSRQMELAEVVLCNASMQLKMKVGVSGDISRAVFFMHKQLLCGFEWIQPKLNQCESVFDICCWWQRVGNAWWLGNSFSDFVIPRIENSDSCLFQLYNLLYFLCFKVAWYFLETCITAGTLSCNLYMFPFYILFGRTTVAHGLHL